LQARAREIQLIQYLQEKFIGDHKIPQIGPGRTATLAAYGIETAFDVVEAVILNVPGFSEGLTQYLVQWRQTLESQFVFNAAKGIPPHELQALDAKLAQPRQQVELGLLAGDQSLKAIAARAKSESLKLYEHITTCLLKLSHANSDLSIIPPGL
jgi:DNA-binding helix-hairpin-helix protein with protein kinase domain